MLLVLAVVGLLTHYGPLDFLSRGIFCFFVGGAIAKACGQLRQGYGRWFVWYFSALIAVSVLRFGKFGYAGTVLLLGAVIASLLVSDRMLAPVSRRLARLGDASYSLYLLHFPLQLGCALALIKWRGSYFPGLFLSNWAFIGFFATLIGLALISHRYLEMPVQRLMRSWAE